MWRGNKLFRIQQCINHYVRQNVKNQSRNILRLWMDHCEYIAAQRFRRGQQMICLYRRIWEEQALRELLQCFHRQVSLPFERPTYWIVILIDHMPLHFNRVVCYYSIFKLYVMSNVRSSIRLPFE